MILSPIVRFHFEDFMFHERLCFFRAKRPTTRSAVETCLAVKMHLRALALGADNDLNFSIGHFLSDLLPTMKCFHFTFQPDVLSA